MSPVHRADAPRTTQEAAIAVGALAGIEPTAIRAYAVLVDDGSRQATVITNVDQLPLLAMLVGVLRVLAGEIS